MGTHAQASPRAPVSIRNAMKPRRKFTCTDCFNEIEGWAYEVGMSHYEKREICSRCWAEPRVAPMRPVGFGVILG